MDKVSYNWCDIRTYDAKLVDFNMDLQKQTRAMTKVFKAYAKKKGFVYEKPCLRCCYT